MTQMANRRRMRAMGAALSAALLTGCGTADGEVSGPTVYAAYVLLAPGADGGTIAYARAIVAPGQAECPMLAGGDAPIRMSVRQNPHSFPVDVCEAAIPFGRRLRLSWTDQLLPAARTNPRRLLVLGDTGCKSGDCAVADPAAPFAAIAAAAALRPAPDLVLHVGDYNYRGTPGSVRVKGSATMLPVYDAGDKTPDDPDCQLTSPYVSQNAAFSEQPDNWDDWWHDFFQPAAPLLARAPWVFVRGNHELCSRAGPGWFYFLDASAEPALGGSGQLACPFQGGDQPPDDAVLTHLRFVPPYTLDLGTLRLAVVDSANACDGFAPDPTSRIYADQFRQVLDAVPPGIPTWIATHRPLWAAIQASTTAAEPPAYDGGSATLRVALADAVGPGTLPDELRLFVGGHVHTFQSVTFLDDAAAPLPPQLVIGDSGVALDPNTPTGTFDATLDTVAAHLLGIAQFGFLDVAALRPDGSWRGTLRGANRTVLADCDTANLPASLCTAGSAPPSS